MLIAKISGGLGNQMFQYAFALAIAEHFGCECKFDLDWFDTSTLHNGLEIDKVFGLELPRATHFESFKVLGWKYPIIKALGPRVLSEKISFLTQKLILTEHSFKFPLVNKTAKLTKGYIAGYWQSEDYFVDYKSKIRAAFTFKNDPHITHYEKLISHATYPVAVHIRRGDYVADMKNSDLLGVCSVDYYHEAILELETRIAAKPVYFIFSDDIEWSKKHFGFLENSVFVTGNKGVYSYLDMYLMSLCDHHIIANSTFSWWGAWLSSSPSKLVYAPTPWFNQHLPVKPVCPTKWILLNKNSYGI